MSVVHNSGSDQREEELKMLKGLHTSQAADETEKYKIEYLQLMIDLKVYIPVSSLEFWFLTHEKSPVDTMQLKPETNDKIKSVLAVLDLSKEEQGRWMFENLPEYRDSDLSLGTFAFSMWKPLMDQIRVMKPPPVKRVKESLERWRNVEKEPAISYRFRDAQNALLWKCWGRKEFLSREEAERILLLTWLITDREAEQVRLGITEFENWAWNQGLRGRDFVYYETFIKDFGEIGNKWLKLVRLAWAKVEAEKNLESKKSAEAERKTQFVEELTASEPKPETWQELSIEVVDNETIKYRVGNRRWEHVNYAQFGFMDKRRGRPNKLWPIFLEMSKYCSGGYINMPTPKNISKDIDRICATLQKFFGIQERPIPYDKKVRAYHVKCDFTDKRNW